MDGLPLKDMEVLDFSGGMTDFYLQGDQKRYEFAKNYLINVDKRLESRPGSRGLPGGNHKLDQRYRINEWLHYDDESELLVQQAGKIFYKNPGWTEIVGPTGNEAVPGADAMDSLSYSALSKHIYYTSSGDVLPGKIYRDQNNNWQVRTVGLPAPTSAPQYTNGSLITACITLANELRASMISHMNDITLHDDVDKWSMSYFAAQMWNPMFDDEYPGPQPTPTPAPAATSEATLYPLVQALALVYEHHGFDPDTTKMRYHKDIEVVVAPGGEIVPAKGPYQLLKNDTLPKDLPTAAAQLDEIKQKWNWHIANVYTHDQNNDPTNFLKYLVTAPKIGAIDLVGVPVLTGDNRQFIRYCNYLKFLYNMHVSSGEFGADWNPIDTRGHEDDFGGFSRNHTQPLFVGNSPLCTIPDATDLDSGYLILYWVWALYGQLHISDASYPIHTDFTFDVLMGTGDLTNCKDDDTNNVAFSEGDVITLLGTGLFSGPINYSTYRVTVGGAGSCTIANTAAIDSTGVVAQVSSSLFHASFQDTDAGRGFKTSTASVIDDAETLDPAPKSGLADANNALPADHSGWIEFAQVLFTAIALHAGDSNAHLVPQAAGAFLSGNGPFFLPQIQSRAYAAVWKTKYFTANGVEFEDFGPPIFFGPLTTEKSLVPGSLQPSGFPDETTYTGYSRAVVDTAVQTLSSLPKLVNTLLTNYDTPNAVLQLYATQDGGNTYYLLDELANGTATYEESVSDTDTINGVSPLPDHEVLYTTGGVVANDPPPQAKCIYIMQNTAYYGNVSDDGEAFPNRILQSVPGVLGGVPANFSDDLDSEVMGISSVRNNLIVFCRRHVYRMSGGYDSEGGGSLLHESISDGVGCISARSIVQTEIGLFYAGTDGFYYTDGFQNIKISIDLDKTYLARTTSAVQQSLIHGAYDNLTRRIWWTVQSAETGAGCDEVFVYYLNYGVKPSGVFTTCDNVTNFQPSCFTFFDGVMYRGDERGLMFYHKDYFKSDPKVPADVTTALSDWGFAYIPWDYRSCAMDFGSIDVGNYVTRFKLMGKNSGNCNVQVAGIADNNYFSPSNRKLAPIVYRDNSIWGQPKNQTWGNPDFNWKYDGKLDYWRRFPSGNLRAQLKQIEISPARCGVYSYDEMPKFSYVNVNGTSKVVTLLTPPGYTGLLWPTDVEGMTIAFETDDYDDEFEITSANAPSPADSNEIQERPVHTGGAVYTLNTAPISAASVLVWVDGIFQRQGTDYTIVGAVITFAVAPGAGQIVDTNYFSASIATFYQEGFNPDGATSDFDLAHVPVSVADAVVFLDGIMLRYTLDYTISGSTVSLVAVPDDNQLLDVAYKSGSNVSIARQDLLLGPIDGNNKIFTLPRIPTVASNVKIFLDGVFQTQGTDYTIDGQTVTFVDAPAAEQLLDAVYNYGVAATLTVSDPNNLLKDMLKKKWVIRGFQVEAGFSMLGYAMRYANFGQRGRQYVSKSGSGNNK